jgi:glycosyltransferase involved in cell wall biosynthesis
MKICFLAGANSIHSYRWIKYFAESGYEISWISLAPSINKPLPNVRYFEINCERSIVDLLKAALKVRGILASERPDILHVHSVGTYGVVALLSGVKNIFVTPWGSDVIYGKKSKIKRLFIGAILKRANFITCDALHMQNELIQLGVLPDRINIINFGIDTEKFSPKPFSKEIRELYELADAPCVISLRNFEKVYDIETLLRAIPEVLKNNPSVRFMLVGKGTLENKLKSLAEDLGIEKAVKFVGFVPNDQLPDTLNSMNIYVSTSLSDAGIAASTAEAMACGLPVVISDSGENSAWINDGENGFLVPVSQPNTLAEKISLLLENEALRRKMGEYARATIISRNDYLVEMAKMKRLYKKALDE